MEIVDFIPQVVDSFQLLDGTYLQEQEERIYRHGKDLPFETQYWPITINHNMYFLGRSDLFHPNELIDTQDRMGVVAAVDLHFSLLPEKYRCDYIIRFKSSIVPASLCRWVNLNHLVHHLLADVYGASHQHIGFVSDEFRMARLNESGLNAVLNLKR